MFSLCVRKYIVSRNKNEMFTFASRNRNLVLRFFERAGKILKCFPFIKLAPTLYF